MKNIDLCYVEELAKKYAESVPGYNLVHYYEAAFPAYKVMLDMTVEKKRPLGIIKEFCLKYISLRTNKKEYLAKFLGLEKSIVSSHIIELYQYDLINIDFTNGEMLEITEKGKEALEKIGLVTPENISYRCIIDGLTGEYKRNETLDRAEFVKKIKRHIIPKNIDKPKMENIDIKELNSVIKDEQRIEPRECLDGILVNINAIEEISLEYRKMYILVFMDDNNNIDVQVYDRRKRMNEYEHILLKMIKEKYDILEMDYKLDDIDDNKAYTFSVSNEVVNEAIESVRAIEDIEQRIEELDSEILNNEKDRYLEDEDYMSKTQIINEQKQQLDILREELSSKPRMLSTYDHRPLLFEAIEKVDKQLIIVSPWIRKDAADYEFRIAIESALKRNVKVIICYGIGMKKDQDTEYALKLLKAIQMKKNFGKNLFLIKLGNTHEKILICDNRFMITTSFNWLSFKGDPKRGFRQETGIYLEDKECIENMFGDLENRINQKKYDIKLEMFNE